MFNLKEFITKNIVNGIKNGTFSKEYGNIMAVNYLVKGILTEDDVANIDAQITAWEEEQASTNVDVPEETTIPDEPAVEEPEEVTEPTEEPETTEPEETENETVSEENEPENTETETEPEESEPVE